MEKDWRADGTGPRCTDCSKRDLCNRRAFVLELVKVIVTPRMLLAISFLILTIVQMCTGG